MREGRAGREGVSKVFFVVMKRRKIFVSHLFGKIFGLFCWNGILLRRVELEDLWWFFLPF